MEDTSENKKNSNLKKRINIGLLAHVDAGKTTLSESILYLTGKIRNLGRVDNQDAYLDTYELERQRGITIFSKQAGFSIKDAEFMLLDTPGHVDFSAEMERTLMVLDYAVMIISGADGVQGHTLTLWRLLKRYDIPVFFFVNKMDQPGAERDKLLFELKNRFGEYVVDFSDSIEGFSAEIAEQIAVCDEEVLEHFLENEEISKTQIQDMIRCRKLFPCFFGSALKLDGVSALLSALYEYTVMPSYPEAFGAKVFKIARDTLGNRLTYLKVTGGSLKVKSMLGAEKVNQIRIYSGDKFETAMEVPAGQVCAVTGLSSSYPGEGLGAEKESELPVLEPVLTYQMCLPDGISVNQFLPKLRQLEEEVPELHVVWKEELCELQVQLMGEVQIEILKHMIAERFGVEVEFGMGSIVYKETIADTVEGVGHFEPLRHYAEVHLLLEPLEPGSGMQFALDCSEDMLSKNWQRLILTHLEEKQFPGVLTGSSITDMKITVIGGRAHNKHTEGGDFRQATYRAVRQGLMQAQSVLLEPYYNFRLEIPSECVGRAMTDLEKMNANTEPPVVEGEFSILTGTVPVITIRDYQISVTAYTKGRGSLFCSLKGYEPCHNAEEVIEHFQYDAVSDVPNTPDSVFCAHGAGFIVPWNQVFDYMHVECTCREKENNAGEEFRLQPSRTVYPSKPVEEMWIDQEEMEEIYQRTFASNKKKSKHWKKKNVVQKMQQYQSVKKKPQVLKEKYLIVDGYNVCYAWEELKCHMNDNIDGARTQLMDVLCDYQAYTRETVILVFDAYRVKGNIGEMYPYHNIHVIYTKEAETADQYIAKLTHEIGGKYDVTVATSDGLVQLITRGQNCKILSAGDLKERIHTMREEIREQYLNKEQ